MASASPSSSSPPSWLPSWMQGTFEWFARQEGIGGILIVLAAAAALVLANSPLSATYFAVRDVPITVAIGGAGISKPLLLWVNDGLMAIFFFVVGLEIKREVLTGELSSLREAAFPATAAIGGMLVPALLYAALNAGGAGAAGWGIPMATDIAFALGILMLLGDRAPLALKVFLTAVAIVDDLGAVLVIALFYTAEISIAALAVGAIVFAGLLALNLGGVRSVLAYAVGGLVLWVAVLKSGVHATVAGVALAMTIPASRRIEAATFLKTARDLLDRFARAGDDESPSNVGYRQDLVHALEEATIDVETPLTRLEHALHPWVTYVILPVFALANAGVVLGGEMIADAIRSPIALGIVAGLVVGKQIGVTGFAYLSVRWGWAELPPDISWRQIYGVAWLTGVGFTMSLFIADLAFLEPVRLDTAKVGILVASLISATGGWILLSTGSRARA